MASLAFAKQLAEKAGKATLAVVYNPILNCLYHAEKGVGAFRNDIRIHVSDVKNLSEALVLTDWGGDRTPESLDKKSNNMRKIIAKARGARYTGKLYALPFSLSLSMRMSSLACHSDTKPYYIGNRLILAFVVVVATIKYKT